MTYSKLVAFSNIAELNSTYSTINEDIPQRLGPNYQVDIPEFESHNPPDDYQDESTLVWQPNSDMIDDETVDNYLDEVRRLYGYDFLQALALLFRLDYNTQAAITEICRLVG